MKLGVKTIVCKNLKEVEAELNYLADDYEILNVQYFFDNINILKALVTYIVER